MIRVTLNAGSSQDDRVKLYKAIHGCGYVRQPRRRKGWVIALVPYSGPQTKPVRTERLWEVLEGSPAVSSCVADVGGGI